MDRLTSRVALVTAAGRGIGRSIALRLAAEGAAVVVTDVEMEPARKVELEIEKTGGRALALQHDAGSEESWQQVIDRIVAEFGGLGILVNNAGIGRPFSLEETTLQEYEFVIRVSQTSAFLGMRTASAALQASGHGSVINISSIFGIAGGFGDQPAYASAKGALRNLTKNVALAWADKGVRVNSIHPGFINTRLLENVKGTPLEDALVATTPMGRLGEASEVAAAVAFFASDDASFCTGSELAVDGGYLAR